MDFNSLFSALGAQSPPPPPPAETTSAYGFGGYGVSILIIMILVFIWSKFRSVGFARFPGYDGPGVYGGCSGPNILGSPNGFTSFGGFRNSPYG